MSAARGMVPEDLTRIQFVTDPQIAPDGRRIAFVVTRLSEERDEYLSNIWIVDATGGTPRRFTAGPRRDLEPSGDQRGSRSCPSGRRRTSSSSTSCRQTAASPRS